MYAWVLPSEISNYFGLRMSEEKEKLISCQINVNFAKFTSYFAKTSFFAQFKKRKFVRLYRHPPTTPSSQVDKSRMEAAELANSPPPCGKNKLPTSTQRGF